MNRQAQAVVEFMTTYGWMLLIAVLVAGAMSYLGVFDPDKLLPQKCDMGIDFSCKNYNLQTDGEINVRLKNMIGETLIIQDFYCTYPDSTDHNDVASQGKTWNVGTTFDFKCPIAGAGTFTENERVQVDLTLLYQKNGGFVKTVSGQMDANAVAP